jgi:hypothetical protein
MGETETKIVQYCIDKVYYNPDTQEEKREPFSGMDVVLGDVCLDMNELFGCQGADDLFPGAFTVTVLEPVTGDDGCADIELKTEEASGLYYFKLNGDLGGSVVTGETGSVLVPEFGVLGAVGILAVAGLFISKKR